MTGDSKSVWFETAGLPRFDGLGRRAIRVDVAIIGGGITGLTSGYLLKRAGVRVAVLEMGRIGHGESGHTTAHLTQFLDSRYHELKRRFGRTEARKAGESSAAAIRQIEELVEDLGIDCGFERVPAYLYSEDRKDLSELEKESRAMEGLGLSPTVHESAPLPFPTVGAIRLASQARFHPLRYLAALAKRVHGSGSFVFEDSQVLSVNDGKPCVIKTDKGIVQADRVICAAHAPSVSPYILQTLVYPYRTYAIGAKCRGLEDLGGLFYDTEDPYHHIRTSEGMLIVGGEDHKVGMRRNTEQCFDSLLRYSRARFDLDSVPYHWSGQVLNSADGLPYIGKSPAARNTYVATGFSGTGLTFGTLSAMLCSDLVLGNRNPYAGLYSTRRVKPVASAREFVTENVEYPISMLKDRLTRGEARSVAEVKKGEGRLIREGFSKSAVYRDETGKVHAFSAVCPHMGCMVHFNAAEKSWDCPCHGSRFSTRGEVLNGPALTGLKPADTTKDAPEESAGERPEPPRRAA